MKNVFVTGITGQDGSYLAELLLERGYRVFGLVRRSSHPVIGRIAHLVNDVELLRGDMTDQASLDRAVGLVKPDEVYNLAAQSFVPDSFSAPESTENITGMGAVRLFEAVRQHGLSTTRIFQASSSEMYGNCEQVLQDERSPFAPVSPYGCAKLYAHAMAQTYRQAYGMFIACGIMFNHESERRGEEFVSQKIVLAATRIARGEQTHGLGLGNVESQRDWGYAPEYMDAAHRMLQANAPAVYILATGETHSVWEFAVEAFKAVGLDAGRYVSTLQQTRPIDIGRLCGNALLARQNLGWTPQTRFVELVHRMVEHERLSVLQPSIN